MSPSFSGKLAWTLSRLGAMGPGEIGWRVGERLRAAWEGRSAGRESFRPLAAPQGAALRAALAHGLRPLVPPAAWAARLEGEFPAAYARLRDAARAAAAGRVTLFAREYAVGVPTDWHTDPGGAARPSRDPAAALDLRDDSRLGSVRRIWELNRHHHLAEAALWAWAARDREVGGFVVAQLDDWCEANPPPIGVNWTSSLELAVRTLAWAEILALLVDAEEPALSDAALARIVGAWVRQVEHVRSHDSRYSSANNHRIGEAAGVAVAGLALAFHPRAADWWRWGRGALEEELLLQLAPDGSGREQAFAYQRFVLDFAVLVCSMARGHGRDLNPAVHARLWGAARFLAVVTRPDGQPFAVGDDDEGRAFALGESYEERTEATLETLGWLYGEPAWRRAARPRARWLGLAREAGTAAVGAAGAPGAAPVSGAAPAAFVESFPDAGYAVVTVPGAVPLRALFDAGPLGYGALAAHGHADALSLCLWAGTDLLLDPGTGSYGGDPAWREALRGTGAHNTCELDGRDQSERRGPFLWGRKARARLLAGAGRAPYFVVAGGHDGYAPRGVAELRRTAAGCALPGGVALVVLDEAAGSGEHRLRVPWSLGAGVPSPAGDGAGPLWEVRYPDGTLLRALAIGLTRSGCVALGGETACGGEWPAGAWYAPRFEERAPQGRIAVEAVLPLPASVVWLLHAAWGGAAGASPAVAPAFRPVEGGVALRCDLGGGTTLHALVARPGGAAVAGDGAALAGRLAVWLGDEPAGGAPTGAAVAEATELRTAQTSWRSPTAFTGVLPQAGPA
jgi:hypothetical protein